MATTTPRIGLTKPDGTDLVDIAVLNTNFDKIDSNIASTKIQSTKPTTANAGDLWWDSDTGTLYLYYVDANSSQWVAATSDPINIGVVANQTERDAQYPTPAQGMSVYRTDLGALQRYYGLFNSSTNPGGKTTAGWYIDGEQYVVGSSAERDARFPSPIQGDSVFRSDVGVQETYHGLYNVSTNPGGRDAAGYWQTTETDGLVPCKPSTVTIGGGGTGASSSIGLVSFSNATSVSLDNVFYGSIYKSFKILVKLHGQNNAGVLYMKLRAAGTDDSSNNYHAGGVFGRTNGTGGYTGASTNSASQILQYVAMTDWTLAAVIDIFDPNVANQTTFTQSSWNYDGSGPYGMFRNGMLYSTTIYDGVSIIASAGTVSGTVEVFGYNG